MKTSFKLIVITSLIATAGFSAMAQMGSHGDMMGADGRKGHMSQMDPAKMQAMHAKRTADLKAKLKITAAQETAWTAFSTAMTPPAGVQRPDRAELAKLTAPERMEKMKSLHAQHGAEMDKRAEAIKTFYAVLTPEQKKVFDAEHMGGRNGGKHGGRGDHQHGSK